MKVLKSRYKEFPVLTQPARWPTGTFHDAPYGEVLGIPGKS